MQRVEAIPYKSFKDKIRLTKQYRRCKITVYNDFLLIVWRDNNDEG